MLPKFDWVCPLFSARQWVVGLAVVSGLAAVNLSSIQADQSAQATPSQSPTVAQIKPTGPIENIQTGFQFTEGPTMAEDGSLYFTDIPNTRIHRISPEGQLSVFTDQSNRANGLWALPGGQLLACEMEGSLVRYDLKSGAREVLAHQYNGTRFNACNDLVVDQQGGIYFTDPLYNAPKPLPQKIQAVYYRSPDGVVTRLTDHIKAPNGIGLSLDEKQLYVIPSQQAEMLVYDISEPGKLANHRTFCVLKQPEGKTDTGGDGMTMDRQENLYITTHLGVQIYSPQGQHLGTVTFPEQPANVTFMGADRKMLVVTARTSLYKVPMPIAGRQ
ncbi:SMP-30/gluconolactonase/LRE family protein [Neorhodopirellula lusitana]|uniref:SMP-30/gluconolactonase/LRE family protein n=1 Tax=Neorhodopirellula lusitana TaxID=445327 RepID=UPI00384FE60C